MIYYGVDTEDALLMRMAGVPRRLAKSLSHIVPKNETLSLTDIRKKIGSLSDEQWTKFIPKNSNLSAQDWKKLAHILVK
jgi:hypothetical protein